MEQGTQISLVRHGEGEHNLNKDVYQGRAPEANLTSLGTEQARRLGVRLKQERAPACIVASSLPRTMQTAELIARELEMKVHPEDAFWELSKGEWEKTMPIDKVPAEFAGKLLAEPFEFRYPGGESYQDVHERVSPVFEQWLGRFPGQRILFVLHGDVIRCLIYHLLRFPGEKIGDFSLDPCSMTEWSHRNKRLVLMRFNDSAHLRAAP